jgi:hypothetical protein
VLLVGGVQPDVPNGPGCRVQDEVMELEMVLLVRKVQPDVPGGPDQRM